MPEENLTTLDEGIRSVQRHKSGERTADRIPTSEAVGDPDEGSPEASSQSGAATGAILGTAIAGPLGMAAGAGLGAGAGAATAGDADRPRTRDDLRKDEQFDDWRSDDGDTNDANDTYERAARR